MLVFFINQLSSCWGRTHEGRIIYEWPIYTNPSDFLVEQWRLFVNVLAVAQVANVAVTSAAQRLDRLHGFLAAWKRKIFHHWLFTSWLLPGDCVESILVLDKSMFSRMILIYLLLLDTDWCRLLNIAVWCWKNDKKNFLINTLFFLALNAIWTILPSTELNYYFVTKIILELYHFVLFRFYYFTKLYQLVREKEKIQQN